MKTLSLQNLCQGYQNCTESARDDYYNMVVQLFNNGFINEFVLNEFKFGIEHIYK